MHYTCSKFQGANMIVSNIRQIMENKKITVRRMMEVTGLANETVLRARGAQILQCHLETLERIALCLDCKVKDLFDET
jgi:DNA-binding Xre family transcriptional regulator